MEILFSKVFEAPQHVYLTSREGLSPLLYQEQEIGEKTLFKWSELKENGETSLIYSAFNDPEKRSDVYLSWEKHGPEIAKWVRGTDGEQYVREITRLPWRSRSEEQRYAVTYSHFALYLDPDRLLCTETPDGNLVCKNMRNERLFSLPVCISNNMEVTADGGIIFMYDAELQTLYTYRHDGTEFHAPISMPPALLSPANYYLPHFFEENGSIAIRGLDQDYNYVKYAFADDGPPAETRLFTMPEGFHFYRYAEYQDRAAIHGISDDVTCWAFSTCTPGGLSQRMFSRKISGSEPPLGDILWADRDHLVFVESKRNGSKLTMYSTSGKRTGSVQLPGDLVWIGEGDDICSDGKHLYVLSHENTRWRTHSTLTIIQIL